MLRAPFMAALHCPNPECPFFKKFNAPAEYREGFSTCSDCGSALAAGSAPAPVPPVAAAEAAPELMASMPRAESAAGDLVRRVAISLAVLIAAALSHLVVLPGIDPFILETLESIERTGASLDSRLPLGVFSLDLNPLLSAFLIVEVAALLIPPWRRLRTGGPRERARLRTATLVLGLGLALFQSFGMTQFYLSFNFEGRALFSGPGALPMPAVALLLVGGVVALHLLTVLVDRAGLGNGYAVVILGLTLPAAASTVNLMWTSAQQETLSTTELAVMVLGLVAIAWGTARMLRGEFLGKGATERPQRLPLPASGLAPLYLAGGLLALPSLLSNVLNLPVFLDVSQELEGNTLAYSVTDFVLLTLFTAGFSVLFYRPRYVGEVWATLTAKDPAERALVQGRAAIRARELLPNTAAWSLGFIMLAWLLPHLGSTLLSIPFPNAVALIMGVAIVLDLIDEARMRQRGTWASAWPVHRVYEVEPALAALSAAGIPAWARGQYARATLQFFAPYFPIELMVPADKAEEARALIEKSRQP